VSAAAQRNQKLTVACAHPTHSSSHYPNARWVRFSSVLEDEQQTVFKGEALLLEDVGVSVISDIGTSANPSCC
jgi:hypothetical protein